MTTVILYALGALLAGIICAYRDNHKYRLLTIESGIVIWITTGIVFTLALLGGVPAWTILLFPTGYHLATRRIVNKGQYNNPELAEESK